MGNVTVGLTLIKGSRGGSTVRKCTYAYVFVVVAVSLIVDIAVNLDEIISLL